MRGMCLVCSQTFTMDNCGNKKFCSNECRSKYHNRMRLGLPIDIPTEQEIYKEKCRQEGCLLSSECPVCHKVFDKKEYWQQYCCIKHRDIARRRREKNLPLDTKSRFQKTPEERFWEKVDKNGPLPNHCPEIGNCWEWIGALSHGYGSFAISRKDYENGGINRAHIYSYVLASGAIPTGMIICHKCDNRKCVRPDHLWPDTHHGNNLDMANKLYKMRKEITPYNVLTNINLDLLSDDQLQVAIINCKNEFEKRGRILY